LRGVERERERGREGERKRGRDSVDKHRVRRQIEKSWQGFIGF